MFARFLIPILGLLVFLFYRTVVHLYRPGIGPVWSIALAVLLSGPGVDLFPANRLHSWRGITEEWSVYRRDIMEKTAKKMSQISPVVRQSEARMAFWGGEAFIVYYMDPIYALESETGLTDETLASRKRQEAGRTGHDKNADYAFLLERNIHVSLKAPPPERKLRSQTMHIQGIPVPVEIIEHDPEVFAILTASPRIHLLP